MFTHNQQRQWQDIRLRAVEQITTKVRGTPPTRAERDRQILCDLLEIAVARVAELEQLPLFVDDAETSR